MKSDSINELAAALAKAQQEIKPALKDSNNPFFKSKYADLSSTWEACKDALNKNGLSVVQTIEENYLSTTLLHTSGQWISGKCPLINQKGDMQGLGSAISYARRYSIAAICGVTTDDDDANSADLKSVPKDQAFTRTSPGSISAPTPSAPSRLISEKQAKMVWAKMASLGMKSEAMKKFLGETVGCHVTDHIPLDKLDMVLAKLDQTVTTSASTWDMK